jgi:hypothetical protein
MRVTVSFSYGLCPINRPKPLHSLRSRVTASLFAHKCAISLTLECLLVRLVFSKEKELELIQLRAKRVIKEVKF